MHIYRKNPCQRVQKQKKSFFDWNWSENIKNAAKTSLLAVFNRLQQMSGRSKGARRQLNKLVVNPKTNV